MQEVHALCAPQRRKKNQQMKTNSERHQKRRKKYAEELAQCDIDEATHFFNEYGRERRKHVEQRKRDFNSGDQNARPLAISKHAFQMTAAEKKAELEAIKAQIAALQDEICANKRMAGKLLSNAVFHAKAIGDRSLYAKGHLLEHGEYEDWVEKNFEGGISTMRVYTRIAHYKNWPKIAKKAYSPKGL